VGTLVIGALDIGALLIGGIIGAHVKPVVTKCSPDEKAAVQAKVAEFKALLDKMVDAL
jgi:hypothetical protein